MQDTTAKFSARIPMSFLLSFSLSLNIASHVSGKKVHFDDDLEDLQDRAAQ